MLPAIDGLLQQMARDENQALVSTARMLIAPSVASGVTWTAVKVMRRSSSTRRHFVLTLGVAAALLLPRCNDAFGLGDSLLFQLKQLPR